MDNSANYTLAETLSPFFYEWSPCINQAKALDIPFQQNQGKKLGISKFSKWNLAYMQVVTLSITPTLIHHNYSLALSPILALF